MDWINEFYSTTGEWWGGAESATTESDENRAKIIKRICPTSKIVLELGCGYGNTAAATASAGFDVVANELSDRIKFAKKFKNEKYIGSLKFVKGDFYTTELGKNYDVVAYWNGFGIGTDMDQRRLLKRICDDWLADNGRALIDIGNPFVRSSWAGEVEHKDASPERGYHHTIDEVIDYDPVHNRFIDTWWESKSPDKKFTQTIRNYTPADLVLLLEGTGLKIESIFVGDEKVNVNSDYVGFAGLLKDSQEYLVVLKKI